MSQEVVEGSDQNSKSCRVLSVALSDIIRHSTNVDFRDRCFKILRTDCSFGVQTMLATDLLSTISRKHSARERQAEMEDTTTRSTENEAQDDFNQNPINLIRPTTAVQHIEKHIKLTN